MRTTMIAILLLVLTSAAVRANVESLQQFLHSAEETAQLTAALRGDGTFDVTSASGKRSDPKPAEALRTLGTTPQSHMCVRNFTSYAKFIYDWYVKGACAVIVLE